MQCDLRKHQENRKMLQKYTKQRKCFWGRCDGTTVVDVRIALGRALKKKKKAYVLSTLSSSYLWPILKQLHLDG